jgi:nucleoside-diphosphate-sugar epimerase
VASRSEQTRPRALLTGCNGFTGRYVARELTAAGYEVLGLAHDNDPPVPGVIRATLLDRAAIREAVERTRADVVIHLAAISFVAHGDADEIYRVNVVGTRNLLEALASAPHQPGSVILASSANIYGNAQDDPITDDTPPAPANDYAVSKLAMEYMARTWMGRLPITIVRPFNYTGVGQSEQFLIPKIVKHFCRGERAIELGNTDVSRDFSDVRDVARAYAAIAKKRSAGQILNICSGTPHSVADVLGMMANIAGYQIEVQTNHAYKRDNEIVRLAGSNVRLLAITGPLSLRPLMETLEWMYAQQIRPTK